MMGLLRPARGTRVSPDLQVYLTDAQRRHFVSIPYLLPHDLSEYNRLEFQHFFLKGVLRADYLAPLERPAAILDVGCGTGRWVIEMAQRFSEARVTGIDVAPVTLAAPNNAHFVQQDILQGLPFAEASFDYVHARLLVLAIPASRWPGLIREYRRVTRPGGWMELFEGGTAFLNVGARTRQFLTWWERASQQRGIDPPLMGRLPELLRSSGLHHVEERRLCVPVGAWGGRVGTMLERNLLAGWGNLKETCVASLGVRPERFDEALAGLPQEWKRQRTTYEYMIAYGQV